SSCGKKHGDRFFIAQFQLWIDGIISAGNWNIPFAPLHLTIYATWSTAPLTGAVRADSCMVIVTYDPIELTMALASWFHHKGKALYKDKVLDLIDRTLYNFGFTEVELDYFITGSEHEYR
ncbi:hypothetical protein CLAFUW4_13224, partial [Fulvia fulva]